MSLFMNDSDPLEILDFDSPSKDGAGDKDDCFIDPTSTKTRRKRKRNPVRMVKAQSKRIRKGSADSGAPIVSIDDELSLVLDSPLRPETPTTEFVAPVAPPKQVDLADQILADQSPVRFTPQPPRSRNFTSARPIYQLSDPDVSTALSITPEGPEALQISLLVSPELLNQEKNLQRNVEERELPKRYLFKLFATQKIKIIVEKFLQIDQSTWSPEDLQLKLFGLEVPFDHTPKDECMAGGEELHLGLKPQPKGDPLSPVSILSPLPERLEIEDSGEEKIAIVLQSRSWGSQTYRMTMDKPFGELYDKFAKQNNLDAQQAKKLLLQFDGETIGRTQKPQDFDMENEDTVDVLIKK